MSRSHRGRKGRGAGAGVGEDDRFRSIHDRLHTALALGLTPPSSQPGNLNRKRWWITDLEVQGQAIRSISAFAAALKCRTTSLAAVQKWLLEDIVAALEGLLASENEQVYTAAADATVELVTLGGGWFLNCGGKELLVPLVRLLACPKREASISSAISMRLILEAMKLKEGLSGENLWKMLQEYGVIVLLTNKLEKLGTLDGKDALLYVAFADLLIFILRYCPLSRFSTGSIASFRAALTAQCKNVNDDVSCAALKVCTSLALCGGAAMLLLKDGEFTWSSISYCLQESQKFSIQLESLRFLTSLSRVSDFSSTVISQHIETICASILKLMDTGSSIYKDIWPTDVGVVVLEAASTACSLLCLPGKHHLFTWKFGIVNVLSNLLIHEDDKESIQLQKADYIGDNRKVGMNNRILGPVLWDVLSWLFIHAEVSIDEFLSENEQQKTTCNSLILFACNLLLKVVNRKGESQFPKIGKHSPVNISYTDSYGVAICKAVLHMLSSQSKYLSIQARNCLEEAFQLHGSDWLLPLVNKLAIGFSRSTVSDDPIILINLIAMASIAHLRECHLQLLQGEILQVLTEVIKSRAVRVLEWNSKGTIISIAASSRLNTCCLINSTWEGDDAILLYSLWAFATLIQGSESAKNLNRKIAMKLHDKKDLENIQDSEVESCLLRIACNEGAAPGLRWWASSSLSSCGFYGFPLSGMNLKGAFDDCTSADVILIFGDGSQLYTHKVILATKCPVLLPQMIYDGASHHRKQSIASSEDSTWVPFPFRIHLSGRLHKAAVKAILEFICYGFTLVDEEIIAEVKLLARRCHLESLLNLIQRKIPLWKPFPVQCDFTYALGGVGCTFSDIVLEAKDEIQASCSLCLLETSHLHAHRILLSSRCSYFQALFRSGMQDSALKGMKVQLTMESLSKLLNYVYSGTLPCLLLPESGCMWTSSSRDKQVQYLMNYVELAHAAEQWLLDELQEQCLSVVWGQLKQNYYLAPQVMKQAALFHQWKFVDAAAECVAPNYPQMRERGELDDLEDYLLDLVRAAHVRISIKSAT